MLLLASPSARLGPLPLCRQAGRPAKFAHSCTGGAAGPHATRQQGGVAVQASQGGDAGGGRPIGEGDDSIPDALKGLRLNKNGDLVDERGMSINDFGATRFDVAVRALRGEFAAPPEEEDNHHSDGAIMDSLVKFPSDYTFQVVGRQGPGFQEDVVACVGGVAGCAVKEVISKERKGGKCAPRSARGEMCSPPAPPTSGASL